MIAEILSGEHDSELEGILEAVHQRRKLMRGATKAVAFATLQIGDKVRLKGLRPKYVNGSTAEVVDKKRTKLVVVLDKPTGRFMGRVTVPADCLDKI
jgi:hypothetical protein